MEDAPKSIRSTLFGIHISFGVLILELIIVRLVWKIKHPAPPMPSGVDPKSIKIGKIVQHSLYSLMLLTPILGYLMVITKGRSVSFFQLYSLPSLMEKNEQLHEVFETIHIYLGWTLAALIILHLLGAFKHRRAGDGVFERMWPKK